MRYRLMASLIAVMLGAFSFLPAMSALSAPKGADHKAVKATKKVKKTKVKNAKAMNRVPIAGTVQSADPSSHLLPHGIAPEGSEFAGTVDFDRFAAHRGKVYAIGKVHGQVTDESGDTANVEDSTVKVPVAPTVPVPPTVDPTPTDTPTPTTTTTDPSTCHVLTLTLDGDLNLNLLGLVVDIKRLDLDVSAQTGPGNLLGNLVCTLAHALDNNPLTPSGSLTTPVANEVAGDLNDGLGSQI